MHIARPVPPSAARARLLAAFAGALLAVVPGTPLSAQHPVVEEAPPSQPEIVEGVDYVVYDRSGTRVSIAEVVDASLGEEVLLVGEEHDDMVGHAFQTELFGLVLRRIADPSASGRPVVLSLEMFERDVQYVLDEYLADLISEDHFLRSARPWDDYEGRYRPAVEAAKAAGAPVVAANAPRRYVNRVTREGPESLGALGEQARAYLPPLPYPGPTDAYRAQFEALMTAAMAPNAVAPGDEPDASEPPEEPGAADPEGADADDAAEPYALSPNVIWSQALWDASMGHAVTEALVRHVGGFVVHFAGSFHVERGTGIVERIADYRPGTRVVTVVMTKVDDVEAWSAEAHAPLADFVVLTRKPADAEAATN